MWNPFRPRLETRSYTDALVSLLPQRIERYDVSDRPGSRGRGRASWKPAESPVRY